MARKSPERNIYDVLMKAIKEATVPFDYYGPETCRWATQEETQRFGLKDYPLVHFDEKGDIDCYFTETEAVTIRPENETNPLGMAASNVDNGKVQAGPQT